ncbi:hypothetical protein A3770_13p68580 [Chloropicon primus]|uniref:RING-type domain-containing protein n=1 Tax=Chloropicon primus TaxID=1764295 RepID=A0A5B8MXW5_9CHLO|nr:hypothetical protein A3770_13p68580 [Chloropicon primus]|eukprot:QDZ24340.1 hypothetical protein A3770_13p68580 [Chloropicon primus]
MNEEETGDMAGAHAMPRTNHDWEDTPGTMVRVPAVDYDAVDGILLAQRRLLMGEPRANATYATIRRVSTEGVEEGWGFQPPSVPSNVTLASVVVIGAATLSMLYVMWRTWRHLGGGGTNEQGQQLRSVNYFPDARGEAVAEEKGLGPLLEEVRQFTFRVFGSKRTVAKYSAGECAICMDAFVEGEKLRELPVCGHVFHCGCVEEWLSEHTTCPICRMDVKATLEKVVEEEGAVTVTLSSNGDRVVFRIRADPLDR